MSRRSGPEPHSNRLEPSPGACPIGAPRTWYGPSSARTPSWTPDSHSGREGWVDFGRGRALYRQLRDREAVVPLGRARQALRALPAGEAWSGAWLASAHRALGEHALADSLAQEILVTLDERRFPALSGRVRWVAGVVSGISGRYGEAGEHYRHVIEGFELAGETGNLALAWGLEAELRKLLGDTDGAWRGRVEALRTLGSLSGERVQFLLLDAADAARSEGLLYASLDFLEVAVANAAVTESAIRMSEARVHRGTARLAVGDTTGAREDEREATGYAERIADPDKAAHALADVWWLRGLAGGGSSRSFDAPFDSALAIHTAQGNDYQRIRVLEARGIRRAAFDPAGARADLLGALEIMERPDSSKLEAAEQIRYADVIRHSLTDLASRASGQDAPLVLEVAERAAALAWSDSARLASLTSLSGVELPDSVSLIRYVVLEDALLAWIFHDDGHATLRTPLSRVALEGEVRDLLDEVRAAASLAEIERSRARLGSLLLPDTIWAAVGDDDLVIVPDGPLTRVPWSVLPGRTASLIVEERPSPYPLPRASRSAPPVDPSRPTGTGVTSCSSATRPHRTPYGIRRS